MSGCLGGSMVLSRWKCHLSVLLVPSGRQVGAPSAFSTGRALEIGGMGTIIHLLTGILCSTTGTVRVSQSTTSSSSM